MMDYLEGNTVERNTDPGDHRSRWEYAVRLKQEVLQEIKNYRMYIAPSPFGTLLRAPFYHAQGLRQYPAVWSVKGLTLIERAQLIMDMSAANGWKVTVGDVVGWDASWRPWHEEKATEIRAIVHANSEAMQETPASRTWLARGGGFRMAAQGPHRSGEGNNYLDNVHLHSLIEETYQAVVIGHAIPNRPRNQAHFYPELIPARVKHRSPAEPGTRVLYEGDDRIGTAPEQGEEKMQIQRRWYLAAGFVSDQELRAAGAGMRITGDDGRELPPADFCSTVIGERAGDGKILTGPKPHVYRNYHRPLHRSTILHSRLFSRKKLGYAQKRNTTGMSTQSIFIHHDYDSTVP